MPIYVYDVIEADGSSGERLEIFQKMADPPLTAHPESGKPVRRVITAAFLGGKNPLAPSKEKLSDRHLEKMGFTKYVKAGGHYEKTIGDGPDLIKRD